MLYTCVRSIVHAIVGRSHRKGRMHSTALALLVGYAVALLSGCAILPIKNLQPVIAPPGANTCDAKITPNILLPHEESQKFHYNYPSDDASKPVSAAYSFEDYDRAIKARVSSKLPSAVAGHPVTVAFLELLTAASGEAQLDAQLADSTPTMRTAMTSVNVGSERASIQRHSARPKLKQSELKDFSNKLFDLQMRHGLADYTVNATNLDILGPQARTLASTRIKLGAAFIAYLKAYYEGTFYDRMGTLVAKPTLPTASTLTNFSVPDAEIVAAETVLLEFLVDCIDTTPIMGNGDTASSATMFYPGGSKNEPTALTTGLGQYIEIPADGCGITVKNVWVLKDLAEATSDQAAAVGGLVVNTAGGISIGLGVLGKISIGDNATLSDLVKTAASDLTLRATLATSYYILRNIQFNPIQP